MAETTLAQPGLEHEPAKKAEPKQKKSQRSNNPDFSGELIQGRVQLAETAVEIRDLAIYEDIDQLSID